MLVVGASRRRRTYSISLIALGGILEGGRKVRGRAVWYLISAVHLYVVGIGLCYPSNLRLASLRHHG